VGLDLVCAVGAWVAKKRWEDSGTGVREMAVGGGLMGFFLRARLLFVCR